VHVHVACGGHIYEEHELHAHGPQCRVAEVDRYLVELLQRRLHVCALSPELLLADEEALHPAHERAERLREEVHREDQLAPVPAHLPLAPAGVVAAGLLDQVHIRHVQRGGHRCLEGIVAQHVHGHQVNGAPGDADDLEQVGVVAKQALAEEGGLAKETGLHVAHGAEDGLPDCLQACEGRIVRIACELDGRLDDVQGGVRVSHSQELLQHPRLHARIAVEDHGVVKAPAPQGLHVRARVEEWLAQRPRSLAVQSGGAIGEGGLVARA